MSGIVLWITGLPGCGKSTLADELKGAFPHLVLLRMDELRRVATPEPTYSEAERDVLYRALVFMAGRLADLGHGVIMDATGNLRKWRLMARDSIAGYAEVYLKCPLEVCRQREGDRLRRRGAPGGVYEKAGEGWPVPGLTAPYEEPLNPELALDAATLTVALELEAVKALIRRLEAC